MKNSMKKALSLVLALVMVVSLVPAMGMNANAAAKKPTKITLKATETLIDTELVTTAKVSVKSVKPAKASKAVTYKSSNKKVAKVDAKGNVTAVGRGTATITATSKVNKKVKATVEITVVGYNYIGLDDVLNILEEKREGFKVVDTRLASDYATRHIMNSVNADCGGMVNEPYNKEAALNNVKAVIDDATTDYLLMCYSGNRYAKNATKLLVELGVSNDHIHIIEGGMKAWDNYDIAREAHTSNYKTVKEFQANKDEYLILDVRTAEKYAEGHIEGAISADCDGAVTGKSYSEATLNISKAIKNVTSDTKIMLVCNSGSRYAQAATKILILENNINGANIYTLVGGMKAWNELSLPTVK